MSVLKLKKLAKSKSELGDKINTLRKAIFMVSNQQIVKQIGDENKDNHWIWNTFKTAKYQN